MQLSGGEGKKVVDKPCSGLERVENGRWNIQESGISKRCQKMHSKCEVQTLYSLGIAQDCVVTKVKVWNSNEKISKSQQIQNDQRIYYQKGIPT